jgi:hypothetical protein
LAIYKKGPRFMSTPERAEQFYANAQTAPVNVTSPGIASLPGISIGDSDLLTLAELAKKLPGRKPGKCIAASTLWRWCVKGVKGHRMPSIALGGTRATTLAAAQQFIDRLTELSAGAAPTVTASQRHEAASEYCSRHGI